jgi:hypothetical protein
MHACHTRVFAIEAVVAPASDHPEQSEDEEAWGAWRPDVVPPTAAPDAEQPDAASEETPVAVPDAEQPDAASEETPVAVPDAEQPDAASEETPVAVPVADHPDVASAPAATPVADHPEVVSEEAPAADDVVMTSAPTADAEVIPSSPTADDEMIPSSPTAEAEAGSVAEPQVEPAAPPVRMWMDLQTIVQEIEEEMRLEQASTVQLHVQLFSKVCDQFLLSATTVMYTANTFSFGLWLFRLEGTLGPALGRLCISNSCCCWGKVELRVGRHY